MSLKVSQTVSITLLIVIAITSPSCSPSGSTNELSLHLEPDLLTLPDGDTIPTNTTLFCLVESSSLILPGQVTIYWETPNGTITNSTQLVTEGSSDSPILYSRVDALVLSQLSYRDAGIYSCVAEYDDNSGSRINLSGTVELQLLPYLQIPNNKREIEVLESGNDTDVELCCEMSGYIRPNRDLHWYKDGEKINLQDNTKRISFTRGNENAAQDGGMKNTHSKLSVLTIRDPVSSDSGIYTCGLSGSYDVMSSRITLAVESVIETVPPLFTQQPPITETVPPSIIIAIVVGCVALLILGIVIIVITLLARMYKKYQKVVRTTPNVSYGVHTSMPERASFDPVPADPLYESIRGIHYEVAMSSMEYYVNEGLGPND